MGGARGLLGPMVLAAVLMPATVGTEPGPVFSMQQGFENDLGGFVSQDARDRVMRSTRAPIFGAASLDVTSRRWGSTVVWQRKLGGGALRGSAYRVAALVRPDALPAGADLRLCAAVGLAQENPERCTAVPRVKGTAVHVEVTLPIDVSADVYYLFVRLRHTNGAPVAYTVDSATATLIGAGAPRAAPPARGFISLPIHPRGRASAPGAVSAEASTVR
jgi:hypothetical protein